MDQIIFSVRFQKKNSKEEAMEVELFLPDTRFKYITIILVGSITMVAILIPNSKRFINFYIQFQLFLI
jgi:hypothetical protein